jgi:hypothetical protein
VQCLLAVPWRRCYGFIIIIMLCYGLNGVHDDDLLAASNDCHAPSAKFAKLHAPSSAPTFSHFL